MRDLDRQRIQSLGAAAGLVEEGGGSPSHRRHRVISFFLRSLPGRRAAAPTRSGIARSGGEVGDGPERARLDSRRRCSEAARERGSEDGVGSRESELQDRKGEGGERGAQR